MVLHEAEPPCNLLRRRPHPEEPEANSADMEQVRELINLIKGVEINGGLVAASFIVRRV